MINIKDKSSFILGIVAIILVLLAVFILDRNSQEDIIKEQQNLKKETLINNNQLTSTGSIPLDEDSIEKQRLLEEKKKQEMIVRVTNTAGKSGEESLCEHIDDEKGKEKCLNNASAAKASEENNIEFCEKISDESWKNRCGDNYYYEEAISGNNLSVCNNITNENLQNNCKSILILREIESVDFDGTIEICSELIGDQKTYCENKFKNINDTELLQTAINDLNIDLCYKIKNSELKTKCQDVILFKKAISFNNPHNCPLIEEESLKTKCETTLDKLNNSN